MRHTRRPYWIPYDAPPDDFPPVERALRYPDGLLAIGGDLSPTRLLTAYRRGIFPWYGDDQPILWWSPDPRLVLFPEHLKVSRSLGKAMRNKGFEVTLDRAFAEVVAGCSEIFRPAQDGTWITPEMRDAYGELHKQGYAHSVECWRDGELVGGLYGVALGQVFFGESMFSRTSDASKVAFARAVSKLRAWGYQLVDCQVQTRHLESLGAVPVPRRRFLELLDALCARPGKTGPWHGESV